MATPTMSRAEMEAVIRDGRSVLLNGVVYDSIESLPTEAKLAEGDAEKSRLLLAANREQIAALQAQQEQLRAQAEEAEKAQAKAQEAQQQQQEAAAKEQAEAPAPPAGEKPPAAQAEAAPEERPAFGQAVFGEEDQGKRGRRK